jgi:hypothetical protein
MKSLIIPENSYGDDFARQTYALIVMRIEIDPIVEGRLLEKRVFEILNPEDLLYFQSEKNREEARLKADRITEIYIRRAKKFWRVYQLYCFNRGQLRATTVLKSWIKDSDKEIKRLEDVQKNILKGNV